MKETIIENETLKLLRPYHSWDMNYHLINKNTGVEMLIDIDDVYDDGDIEEFGLEELQGMHWDELMELDEHGELPMVIWKSYDKEGNEITNEDLFENYKLLV